MRAFEARMDIDRRCNFRCIYCPSFDAPGETYGFFNTDNLKIIFNKLSKLCWSVWISCSGEPLLHPDFGRVIETANSTFKNTTASLVTNGYLLDQEKRAVINSSVLSRVYISLDTIDPSSYARLCRVGNEALHRTMRNIEELCNLRHRTRSSVSVHVIAIAMKSTIDGFKKLIQWCANTGVQGIRIHWLNIDRKPDQRNEVLDPETAIENLKMQVRAAAATGIAIDYPLGSFLLKLQSQINELKFVKNRAEFLSFITRKYRAQRQRTGCRMLGNTLNIDMAGNVFVCPREERMAGNLFSDTELQLKNNIHYFIKQYSRTLFPECGNCHFNSSEI